MAATPLLSRDGTASARLALAWSSHRLLLRDAGARWPRQHAAQSRCRGEERPEHKAWSFDAEPACGSPRVDAADLSKRLTRIRSRLRVGWYDRLGSWVPFILTRARAHNSHTNACAGAQFPAAPWMNIPIAHSFGSAGAQTRMAISEEVARGRLRMLVFDNRVSIRTRTVTDDLCGCTGRAAMSPDPRFE